MYKWFSKEVLPEQACKVWEWAEGWEGQSQAGVSEDGGRIENNFSSPDGSVSPPCMGNCGVKYCTLAILPFHTQPCWSSVNLICLLDWATDAWIAGKT